MGINNFKIPLIVSIFFYIASLISLYTLPFSKKIDISIVLISSLDYILTLTVLIFFIIQNSIKIRKIERYFIAILEKKLSSYFSLFLFFILVIYVLFNLYDNLILVIVSGYNREGLLNTMESGYLDMLLPSLFSILLVISFKYNYSNKLKIIFSLGILGIMLTYLSRSNLLFLILFFITILGVSSKQLSTKFLVKLIIIIISIVFLASYITVLQGRSSDVFEVIGKIYDTLFRYKAYSFYLSEFSIEISQDIEKNLFAFFGFFSEKILSFITAVSNPISIYGSDFVFKFHDLGNGYKANVLYPWWSWFYGSFGLFGLIFKAIYIYIILHILLKSNLRLSFLYFLYLILFGIEVRHPFLNAASFYSFLSLIIFDLTIKYRIRL